MAMEETGAPTFRVESILGIAYFYRLADARRLEGLLRGLGHNVVVERFWPKLGSWKAEY